MSARIAVIGSFVQDLAFKVHTFPAAGETRIGTFFSGPGGKGSNQAVAAHRQSVPTVFIGAIGNDLFGDGYVYWTKHEELPTKLERTSAPTGAASIVVNKDAQNSIVVALGANDSLSPEHVLGALREHEELSVVLLQAESNLSAVQAALLHAKERKLISILNPAPINTDLTAELLALADIITPNETEAAFLFTHLTGKPFTSDVTKLDDESVLALCNHFPSSTIVITVGALGSILYQRGTPHRALTGVSANTLLRIPPIAVKPIDTTGAGDAFNGGLAAGLVTFSGDLPRALRYATVVAGLSTQREGTAPAMPTRSEVEQYADFFKQ